jgi:hypothetical protein
LRKVTSRQGASRYHTPPSSSMPTAAKMYRKARSSPANVRKGVRMAYLARGRVGVRVGVGLGSGLGLGWG